MDTQNEEEVANASNDGAGAQAGAAEAGGHPPQGESSQGASRGESSQGEPPKGAPQEGTPERIQILENELAEAKDRLARALAESENIRKRAERDKQDTLRYGGAGIARDFIDNVDNLERALSATPNMPQKDIKEVDQLIVGLEMSLKAFLTTFEKHHIKRIDPLGEPFSHETHQAVGEQEHNDIAKGHVAAVLQPGYTLHERLLRPAVVMVSNGKRATPPPPPPKEAPKGE
jgi:molecular chaperone GrpE